MEMKMKDEERDTLCMCDVWRLHMHWEALPVLQQPEEAPKI
jgi:hypothetical protein